MSADYNRSEEKNDDGYFQGIIVKKFNHPGQGATVEHDLLSSKRQFKLCTMVHGQELAAFFWENCLNRSN